MSVKRVVVLSVLWMGCSSSNSQPMVGPDAEADAGSVDASQEVSFTRFSEPGPVPAYEQRRGDAELGRDIFINDGYITCGIPFTLFSQIVGTSAVPDNLPLIPGRTGSNADLPFMYTRFDRDGVDLVSTNCLNCHAGIIGNEVIVGLGNDGNYTIDIPTIAAQFRNALTDPDELREFDRFIARTSVTSPHVRTDTIGVNPADNLPGVLVAHRDPYTWEWSDEPYFPEPDPVVVPLSVPPLWHVGKKNALYYTGMGRRDHARFMMSAALLCTDSVEEAREIDEKFVHVREYLTTLEPPPYPFAIDPQLLERGETVFEATCARCHGTYGVDESYPNLVIALEEVGTDPVLAATAGLSSHPVNAWYNRGFFGELSLIAPARGYNAPPLDGVWATAPYLHNGSIPTLELLLDSSKRPLYWSRNYETPYFDTDEVGVGYLIRSYGKEGAQDSVERDFLYDTSRPGYGRMGHTFGDSLNEADRESLIEYLKTL